MRPFFILWTGQAVSLFGTQVVQFALIWWLTVETGSAAVLATATLVGLAPRALAGPFLGSVVDRFSRRAVMVVADSAAGLAAAGLLLLFATGTATPGWVLALLGIRAVAEALHEPAMIASTSLMVPEDRLTRIQGLNQSLQGLLTIVAAPVGALLVAWLPMPGILAVDVATMACALAALAMVTVPDPRDDADRERPTTLRSTLEDTRAGLRYIAGRRGHATLLAMAAGINLFVTPAFALLPLLVVDRLDGKPMQLGGLTSLFGIGMLAGGVLLGVHGGFRKRIHTALAGMALLGLAVLATGAGSSPTFGRLAIALFGVGLAATLANGPIQAIFQATVDPKYQGRVFALFSSLATLTTPVGLVLAAPVAEAFGVQLWYVAGGVACLAMATAGWLSRAVREIEPQSSRGEPAVEAAPMG